MLGGPLCRPDDPQLIAELRRCQVLLQEFNALPADGNPERIRILTATHPLDAALRRSGVESALPISIGDNAWLGGGVIVCPGITIGPEAVIGAGSVVTRDVPARVLAVGNPCRVLRPLQLTGRC